MYLFELYCYYVGGVGAEDTFSKAAATLVTWLERGDCYFIFIFWGTLFSRKFYSKKKYVIMYLFELYCYYVGGVGAGRHLLEGSRHPRDMAREGTVILLFFLRDFILKKTLFEKNYVIMYVIELYCYYVGGVGAEDTFSKAAATLVTWLEIGDCYFFFIFLRDFIFKKTLFWKKLCYYVGGVGAEDTFSKAAATLVTWLERGDCSKRLLLLLFFLRDFIFKKTLFEKNDVIM